MNSAQQKVAVVTGGSKGIGKAIALSLANLNYNVAIIDILEKGSAVKKEIEDCGVRSCFVQADVSIEKDILNAKSIIEERLGAAQVLINNAGIFPREEALKMSYDLFQKVIDVNLGGTFLCSRIFAQKMMQSRQGVIINIASGRALQPTVNGCHYAASKAAILSLTKSLALEWAPYIRVNAVIPGISDTDQPREVFKSDSELYNQGNTIPLGRIGQPEDTAKVVSFLIGPDASYITGQSICVNGGAIMQ